VYALYRVAEEGLWPPDWPAELEPLRKQARSLAHSAQVIYELRFADREQFEAAWPHILELKSKGAPVILLGGPDSRLGTTLEVGVRILAPLTGSLITPQGSRHPPGAEASVPDGKFLRLGPPWPDHVMSEPGVLPEYVFDDNGTWARYDPAARKEPPRDLRRARLEIELVVDGVIVDLNRIPLPADTPIIDRRSGDRLGK
jgi:hypothetical protein